MQAAFQADLDTKTAEIMPEIRVAISANSPEVRAKIRALAQNAGAHIAGEGASYDVLLLAADASSVAQILEIAAHPTKICTLWMENHPSRTTISRLLRAGVNGILSLEAGAEQFKAALKGIRAGLQVIDPTFTGEQAAPAEAAYSALASEELTDREQQVLAMMAEGLSNKEISSRLAISTHTVKFHISSILGKLGATSRTEAVSLGIRSGRVVI
jgi:DNA-binding NarL/FixJ family response regulator